MAELKYDTIVSTQTVRADVNKWVNLTVNAETGQGIANLQIYGNQWKTAELFQGSQIIDMIYRNLGQTTFLISDNGCCFPVCSKSKWHLRITGVCDKVTYDVVTVTPVKPTFTYRMYQTMNSSSGNVISLPFNYNVDTMVVFSTHELSHLQFTTNGGKPKLFHIQQGTQFFPFAYKFDFQPMINFSRLDTANIVFAASSGTGNVSAVAWTWREMSYPC